ncbi:hypothetical protein G3R49_02230 [Shewanella sp. WXL01]|uniref:Uncharacterized protein n=1 Tax=Shewanella maritima TaxID=2520507 RepID=A0A411PFW8_9GAMM|nr:MULTISPECIES: hypothetical protein [Shewanella]NKF49399.1 hypothetical protein [Shewanella sp. WXL01]QBF82489.1 hypothetical protein EXU30_07095 [Shewanella maritima]
MQKLVAVSLVILGIYLFREYQTAFAIILLVIAVGLIKGSNQGVWFSLLDDKDKNSEESHKD